MRQASSISTSRARISWQRCRNHGTRFRPFHRADHQRRFLDDAGFFTGDFSYRMAQKTLMIEINRSDDCNFRLNDVRRVQPAAQANFIHREFHAAFDKRHERQSGDALEVSGVRGKLATGQKSFDSGVNARPCGRECLVGNIRAVNSNSLVDSLEMRRRIKPAANAGGSNDRIQHRRGGTFAIRAGNVNAGNLKVRIAQRFGESRYIRQAELLHMSLLWRC